MGLGAELVDTCMSMELPCMNISLCVIFLSFTCIWNPIFSSQSCNFPAIFNFGDSNSDTGGIAASSLFVFPPPYGETFFHTPVGRGSDGRLIIDFIAQSFGLPLLHEYLDSLGANFSHGANFAIGGAAIREYSIPFNLTRQYDQFRQFKARSQMIREKGGIFATLMPEKEHFSNALYMFDIGQNDLAQAFLTNISILEIKAFVPNIINDFVANVKNTYKLGGRSFWIHNSGPIGCLAYTLQIFPLGERDNAGCLKPCNKVTRYFNYKLRKAVLQLRMDFPEATFTYVDVYSVKYSLFKEPEKYGFELPLVVCCGYGGKYNFTPGFFCGETITVNGTQIFVDSCERPNVKVIWDGVHYTEAANKFVFDQISTGAFSDPPIPLRMACHRTALH